MNCFPFSLDHFWSISNTDTKKPYPYIFPASFFISVKFPPGQLKSLFNTIFTMFFIGFPFFLPYSTIRHNYWIYQTICQVKPSKFIIKLYTNHNILLVKHGTYKNVERLRATSLSKSGITVHNKSIFNTKWIIYKMVGARSFPQPYLCLQPLLQSPAKIRSPILVNFHLHIPPLLVNKIIFAISLFLRIAIPTVYIKSVFPTSAM